MWLAGVAASITDVAAGRGDSQNHSGIRRQRGFLYGVSSLTASPATKESKEGEGMIKKVKEGYKVLSEKGKNLGGPYKTKAEAEKRLKQVEYFKRHKG
jgi:hypothetical protein